MNVLNYRWQIVYPMAANEFYIVVKDVYSEPQTISQINSL